MLKFLAERRYNFVDVVAISSATLLYYLQHYGYIAVVLMWGLFLSIYLEHKTKE